MRDKLLTTLTFLPVMLSPVAFSGNPPTTPSILSASIHLNGNGNYYKNGIMQVPVVIKYELEDGYTLIEDEVKLFNSNDLNPIESWNWHYTDVDNGFNHDVSNTSRYEKLVENELTTTRFVTPSIDSTLSTMDICFSIKVEREDDPSQVDSFNSCQGETNYHSIRMSAINGNSISSNDIKFTKIPNSNISYNKSSVTFTTTQIDYIGPSTNGVNILNEHGYGKQTATGIITPIANNILLERQSGLGTEFSDWTPHPHRGAISIYMKPGIQDYTVPMYYYDSVSPVELNTVNNSGLGVIATIATTSNRIYRMPESLYYTFYCFSDRSQNYCKYAGGKEYSEVDLGQFKPYFEKLGVLTIQDNYGTILDINFNLVGEDGSDSFGKDAKPLWVEKL